VMIIIMAGIWVAILRLMKDYIVRPLQNVAPLYTTFTATPAEISSFTGDMFTFKTIAPSSIEVYKDAAIPGWQNSVLVSSLKGGRVYRMKLDDATGSSLIPLSTGVDTAAYFAGQGRFRDIAISPDGLKIYVACDLSGATSGPTGGFNNKINTTAPPNAGKILEFTYTGPAARMPTGIPLVTQALKYRMYPNPTNRNITIELSGNEVKTIVTEVYNIVGMKVKATSNYKNKFDVDMKGLPAGIYSVRVLDANGKVLLIEKIIKK